MVNHMIHALDMYMGGVKMIENLQQCLDYCTNVKLENLAMDANGTIKASGGFSIKAKFGRSTRDDGYIEVDLHMHGNNYYHAEKMFCMAVFNLRVLCDTPVAEYGELRRGVI